MKITLKDNVVAEVSKNTTVLSVISGISESLAKSAICGKMNGKLVDLTHEIKKNCKLEIITQKDKDAINVLWHSSGHILAQAVKAVYPNAKLASGECTDNGFYYDFDFKTPITEADLPLIEDEMAKIINANFQVVKAEITKDQAFMLAEENAEPYKLELINKLPSDELVGLYTQGDFSDFCAGPHLKSTGLVKAFKLTRVEQAYFENDPENKPLTRISGVSFFYKKDLDLFLKNQDLIKKRNHMKLGVSRGYFGVDEMSGKIVFFKNGQRVINAITGYIDELADEFGFGEISLPSFENKNTGVVEATAYRASNKELLSFPLRYYIKETVVPKIVNVSRGLFDHALNTRDKFVVFSPVDMVDQEFKTIFEMVKRFYESVGFSVRVRLHVGDDAIPGDYNKVKGLLKRAIDKKFGVTDKIQAGYHKVDVLKVEYLLTDSLGREWSIGSLHVDFSFAQNNGIALNSNGKLEFPITIVSNICKSIERLFAILIETRAGDLPFWISPAAVKIVVTDSKAIGKAERISGMLKKHKVYSDVFILGSGKVKFDSEYPVNIVIGSEELANNTIKILLSSGESLSMTARKVAQELLRSKFDHKNCVDL